MTNYNERLDEILTKHGAEPGEMTHSLKQAITSLFKELVAEARIDELKHLTDDDGIWYQDMTRQFPQKIRLDERIKELEV